MNHFDHPQALEEKFGGWLGDDMPDAFADYADFLFETYGKKVSFFIKFFFFFLNCADSCFVLAAGEVLADRQ